MEQGRIFISYSRANSNFVVRLAKDLKAAGYNTWLDQLDIPPGARWDDELERALEACEIFIVILTPSSTTSDNVKDEIGYAIDARKRILPVLLENAVLPLRLRRFQYVDFTSKNYEDGLESAKRLLNNLSAGQTSPVTEISGRPQVGGRTPENNNPLPVQKSQKKAVRSPQNGVEPAITTQRKTAIPVAAGIAMGLIILVAMGVFFISEFNLHASAAAAPTTDKTPTKVSTLPPTKTAILSAQWTDVTLRDLSFVADDDIGGRFRATQEYAKKSGFVAGFPNFYFNDTTQGYGTILLKDDAVLWRDVPVNELRNTPLSDVPELFRAAHDYATSHGFVGGFPTFFMNDMRMVYGVNLIRPGAGEWRDVPVEELGNPRLDDIPTMFRAVSDYAISHGFVGGFPDFYVDDVRNVYGVILIKSVP